MQAILESTIDQTLRKLDRSSENYQTTIAAFQAQQPVILAYLFSEEFGVLTSKEQEYLLYLALILWKSIVVVQPNLPEVTPSQLESAEEKNWTVYQNAKASNFRERLDVFFHNYQQEDLLAFVEDALILEEEDFLTKEGREPLFIALKTVIDVLTS